MAGLAGWSALSSLTESQERDDHGLLNAVAVEARTPEQIDIGTRFSVTLHPHFAVTASRANGTYTLTQLVYVQTYADEPMPIEWHIEAHQSMQDLLTVAYGHGCGLRIDTGCSSRYPLTAPQTGQRIGDKWRDIVTNWNGRGPAGAPLVLPEPTWPLFSLEDIGPDGVRRWIEETDDWIRVVGPLAASLFQDQVVIELRIMQVAVSLEALGYRIALRQEQIKPGGSLSFPQYLRLIAGSVGCNLSAVLRGNPDNGVPAFQDFNAWATAFNEVYKQAKHADHPMPEPITAWVLAKSAELLLRIWLAREFGVSASTVEMNIR
jgi:hypothetical protein